MNNKFSCMLTYTVILVALLASLACNSPPNDPIIDTDGPLPPFTDTNTMDTIGESYGNNNDSLMSRNLQGISEYSSDYMRGISVTGTGNVVVQADFMVLTIGVETLAKKVVDARNEAARAMANIVSTLETFHIPDKDMKTLLFNIAPKYEYIDHSTVMVGYTVNNQISVKIRESDELGSIIDAATQAGGDITRVHSIKFFVDDTTLLETKARSIAISNMLQKAQQFANLTGVSLGKPIYLREGGAIDTKSDINLRSMVSEMAHGENSTTPIASGELIITSIVYGVFNME